MKIKGLEKDLEKISKFSFKKAMPFVQWMFKYCVLESSLTLAQ